MQIDYLVYELSCFRRQSNIDTIIVLKKSIKEKKQKNLTLEIRANKYGY
jgi:hypothetical protein